MPLRHGQTSPAARDLGHQQVRRPALRRLSGRQDAAWCSQHAAWYHYLVETDPVSFEVVPIDKPAEMNVIIGQAHFIKTVEDLHEALAGASPHLQFGLAFCEASSARLVRRSGNDDELTGLAATNAVAIGAGHAFVILLREGFPINVMNPLKAVPEVCTVFCATANQVDVLVAVTERGRGIIGVIDGLAPVGIEKESDVAYRHSLLRAIGYKLLRHPSTRQAAARSPAIGTEGSIAEAVRPGIRVLPYPWSGTVVLAFGPGRKSRRRGQNAPAPDTVWCRTIASSRCPKHRSHWFPIPGGIMNIDVAVPSERTVGRALAVRQLLQLVLGNGTGEASAMDPPAGCKTTCLPPPGVPGPDGNWR